MRRAIFFLVPILLVLVRSDGTQAQCVPPPNGLISWWPGDGTAVDLESGRDGMMPGCGAFAPGRVDQAFSFDGVDDYVDAGNDASLRPDFPFSVDFWIRRDAETAFYAISSTDTSSHGIYSGFLTMVSGDGAVITGIGNDLGSCSPLYRKNHLTVAGVVPQGSWHHIAVVFENPLTHWIYVDGMPQPTVPSGAATSMSYAAGNRLQLGRVFDPNLGAHVFALGALDEIELHAGILQPGEIAGIFAAEGDGKCKPTGPADFGDAPPPYATCMNDHGACHVIVPGIHLGQCVDAEEDGMPEGNAAGDDLDGDDDEDGVEFLTTLEPRHEARIEVVASTPGFLSVWIDWGGDGSWAELHDVVFEGTPLAAGPNLLSFAVPSLGLPERTTYARFRFCTAPGLAPTGLAGDGEVEDYRVAVAGDPSATDPISWTGVILGQNHPNPFDLQTEIRLGLAREAPVVLTVYTVAGRRVRRLLDRSLGAGDHQVAWDGRDDRGRPVGSGTYFYELRVEGRTIGVRKALVSR